MNYEEKKLNIFLKTSFNNNVMTKNISYEAINITQEMFDSHPGSKILEITAGLETIYRIDITDDEYSKVCNQWSDGIFKIFNSFPRFDWEK